jgi:hypothetical protein
VSELTLAQLLGTDPAVFATAAARWRALADGLDDVAEDLIRGSRDLVDAWRSDSASHTPVQRAAKVRAEVSNCYNPARRIFAALDHHGHAATDLRDQAQRVIDQAYQSGLTVDVATGLVTAPSASSSTEADANLEAVAAVDDDLRTLLERARALDDSTANVLSVNVPNAGTGFGDLSLPPVSRDTVAGQRGRSPEQVHDWWDRLTPEQQEQAIRDYPDVVGWLDGVPVEDRDTANRVMLDRYEFSLQDRQKYLQARWDELSRDPLVPPDGAEARAVREELSTVDRTLAGLGVVDRSLDKLGDRGYLLGIDPAGDGKAIVAVGNPDTARHTAVWVPGLGTDLGSTSGNVDRVMHLQEAADQQTRGVQNDVATVMWLGYDAPEGDSSVVTGERSKQGAGPLRGFVDGLRATHDGGDYHVTAVGHSYGSTVVSQAALPGGFAVDDMVTAGSPGMDTGHAADLHMPAGHVWAGSAADDPVSNPGEHAWLTGGLFGPVGVYVEGDAHGISPHDPDFGANEYHVDTHGHSDYWNPGSDSIDNQARVVVGQYSRVGLEHGQLPPDIPR